MAKKTLLTVHNQQAACCGHPPQLKTGGSNRTSYWENAWGEQYILQLDTATKKCSFWSGDIGWDEELTVYDITKDGFRIKPVKGDNSYYFDREELEVIYALLQQWATWIT